MCQFASIVLTRDKVFWSESSDSHQDIITKHGLIEDGSRGPNILRVEIVPSRKGNFGDLSAWNYRVDHPPQHLRK